MTHPILECLHRSGILRLARLLPSRHFLVLNFHRVKDDPSDFHEGMIEINSAQFRKHLEWLGRRAEFIGEDQISSLRPGGRQKILLTFDDGYRDSFDVVAPLLERAGVPAIFFVTPGMMDRHVLGAWDRIAYLVKKAECESFHFRGREFTLANGSRSTYQSLGHWSQSALPDQGDEFVAELAQAIGVAQPSAEQMAQELLTWDQVRDLRARGFAIGGHGFSHRVLSSLSLDEQAEEIRLAKSRLESEGIRPRSFAFPFGTPDTYSWETREAAVAAGFQYIFSFSDQAPRLKRLDPTLIDRVAYKSTLAKYNFLLSFTGAHNAYQKFRARSHT